jgi:two-component system phosphate regulon sensor histidine kinase PhoR
MEYLLGAAILVIVALVFLLWRVQNRASAQSGATSEFEARLARRDEERTLLDEKLTAFTRVTSDGLIQVNRSGDVVYMNDTARAFLGIVQSEQAFPLREGAWGYDFQLLVNQVMDERGGIISQTVLKGDRAFSVRAVALGAEGERGALLGLTEVTELQRLGRARREFVANISHELRTPVTSLQLLAETLNEDVMNDRAMLADVLNKIRAQVDLLKQLTDELMDLALIESGQAPIRLVSLFAGVLVNEAIKPLRPQAERKAIAIETQIPPDMEVLADPQAIRKVIGNLTHNALKFTPEGGRVTIRAVWENEGADVQISIHDTGIGIPAKDLPRIFERFYKVDRARTRAQGELRGTGLGLAISKHIVEAHGGMIWAESQEGKGSTFFLTLPSGE